MKNTLSWIEHFKQLEKNDAELWFWEHFNWKQQSLWIGKFNSMNHLPMSNQQITDFLNKLLDDLNSYPELKEKTFIKFYFSRNITSNEPDINYILICDLSQLPSDFSNTLTNVVFEKYQLTENIIDSDPKFKQLINHYISWNNYYTYYDLMDEIHN